MPVGDFAKILAAINEDEETVAKTGADMNRTLVAKELLAIAEELIAMEFDTKEEMEKYKKDHDVRPGTKLVVKKQEKKEPAKEEKKSDKQPKLSEMDNDDLEDSVTKHVKLPGSKETNDGETAYYELSTKSGEPARATILWNPSNQPAEEGKTKVGIFVEETDDEGGEGVTLEDGIWEFSDDDSPEEIGKRIDEVVNKALDKN